MKKQESKFGTISLPIPVINKIKEKIQGTGIHSASAYVTFILRQIFSTQEETDKELFSKKVEKEVQLRLKKLGYV